VVTRTGGEFRPVSHVVQSAICHDTQLGVHLTERLEETKQKIIKILYFPCQCNIYNRYLYSPSNNLARRFKQLLTLEWKNVIKQSREDV
jgi:hypothetical protein